jgi:hypothetical protein
MEQSANTSRKASSLKASFAFLFAAATLLSVIAIPTVALAGPVPCSADPNSRQLDFWLGDWSVTYPGASAPSTSIVSLDLDSCLVVESWSGGKSHTGKNFFAFSSDDQGWHGMFADNEGRVHIFEGKVASAAAEFYGPGRTPEGQSVVNRIRIVRVAPHKVEQTWEKSTDKGSTWTTVFKGEYSQKDP